MPTLNHSRPHIAMRFRNLVPALLLGAVVAGCTDLNVTNPNSPSAQTFWKTANDATLGVNAAYNGMLNNGVYGRWIGFALDGRADDAWSGSPWTDLQNFNKFTLGSYDFEVNREIWVHQYQTIFRANQVIAYVPGIAMDATLRNRIVGEARFIRALMYWNLENYYGGNIPLQLTASEPGDRPASAGDAAVWAQIEADLTAAIPALPASYSGADVGRATSGAAQGLLGKVLLQQRKWAAASAALAPVIASGRYSLMPVYGDNFTAMHENNQESLFEIQFGDRSQLPLGVRGLNIAKMEGACGPGYCDLKPRQWFYDQFLVEPKVGGGVDARLDATLFHQGSDSVYGMTFAQRYGPTSTEIFFKKYGEYYIPGDQDWDAAINYRVLRFADILLMQAEALNEQNQTAQAKPLVDSVRVRAGLARLAAGMTQAQMRDEILHQRLLEFGLEGSRWLDLRRQNLLNKAALIPHDDEFNFFVPGKSELLPIPTSEINLNPNIRQNPGY
jgi:starch-binding outer membrane protein, SusD/RagB family